MITYKLKINYQDSRVLTSDMEFVTGDVGAYRLEFAFYDNGARVGLSDKLLTVKARRADGVVLSDSGSISENTALFVPKNELYAVPGELYLEIALTDNAKNYITTKIVMANVIEGLGEPSDIAENGVSVYVTLLNQVKSQIDAANQLIKDSKAYYDEEIAQMQSEVEGAKVAAESAVASVEQLDSELDTMNKQVTDLKNATVTRYGARRVIGASSPDLERIWDAVGLTANVGVDDETVVNDFDSIYPWSHIRTCNIEVVNGEIRVKAYEGEPTFARDGSNGNVAVEFPEFYSCPPYMNDDGYEYFGVSAYPIGGWIKHEKAYYGAYNAGIVDGKLVSISGVFPATTSRTTLRTNARTTDELCGLIDLKYHDALSLLCTVEFATLNTQSKMGGATKLLYAYTVGLESQVAETGVNRIVLLNAGANEFVVGQTIAIGTSMGDSDVANNRIVTDIKIYDSTRKAVYFDGDAIDITSGNFISSRGWITGATDNVAASSGSIISNTNRKYPCKYRGIENPWGNIFQWVDGVNIKEYQAYICTDRAAYTDKQYEDEYIALNYTNASSYGYLKERGYDERYPWARLTETVGGSSSTYYCDYYYGTTGERGLCFGGDFTGVNMGGVWFFHANSGASYAGIFIGSRLCWIS